MGVLLPRHVLVADAFEPSRLPHHLVEERADVRRLHSILPGQLLDQELAVRQQGDVGRAELACPREPADRGRVLGDVVRGLSEPLGDLGKELAVLPEDGDPDAGGTRVAARRAVGADADG
jgi:hypothetical protein